MTVDDLIERLQTLKESDPKAGDLVVLAMNEDQDNIVEMPVPWFQDISEETAKEYDIPRRVVLFHTDL
jgi:hypothetical protein